MKAKHERNNAAPVTDREKLIAWADAIAAVERPVMSVHSSVFFAYKYGQACKHLVEAIKQAAEEVSSVPDPDYPF